MEKILRFLEKRVIPRPLYRLGQPIYHFSLAFLGNLFYGAPSEKLFVIGVTGTKGKTTTSNLIAQILDGAGFKTGKSTSLNFSDGEREWKNATKHAMPGRFKLQKLLREMVRSGCEYAVIETSSEGILQYRHRFVDYDAAVFTNFSPEHIERHGSFENYRAAKLKLFERVAKKKNNLGVFNLDDENVDYFLKPDITKKIGYTLKGNSQINSIKLSNVKLTGKSSEFKIDGEKFILPLIGEFNVYNAAAAVSLALSLGIPLKKIREILKSAKFLPGRLESVDYGQNFIVVLDYAHEPASLEAAYKAMKLFKPKRLIGLLGAQGGGRDKWKRAAMAKIAEEYCDEIIFTNEDPYDEDPLAIINELAAAVDSKKVHKIVDRKEAIQKAILLAKKGDAVILTGKGGEVWMCVEDGRKIPWDEKGIVEEILNNKLQTVNSK